MEYGTNKGQFLVGVSVLRLGAEIRAIAKKYWKEKPKQWEYRYGKTKTPCAPLAEQAIDKENRSQLEIYAEQITLQEITAKNE